MATSKLNSAKGDELIPDPSAKPWPKPIEYVGGAWTLGIIFGPMMMLFWMLADDPWSTETLLVIGGFEVGLAAHVLAMTEWAARAGGVSRRRITAAVLRSLPSRFSPP